MPCRSCGAARSGFRSSSRWRPCRSPNCGCTCPPCGPSVTARQGIAGVAAVVGIYVTTALVHTAPADTGERAHLLARGDHLVRARRSLGRALRRARRGRRTRWSRPSSPRRDSPATPRTPTRLFGVAPWLPALYFAFGVVVALLAEISLRSRYITSAQPLPNRVGVASNIGSGYESRCPVTTLG